MAYLPSGLGLTAVGESRIDVAAPRGGRAVAVEVERGEAMIGRAVTSIVCRTLSRLASFRMLVEQRPARMGVQNNGEHVDVLVQIHLRLPRLR